MEVLYDVIFDDKAKHTEQFHKLSDLVNKTSMYKKDKKLLKKNKRFLKQLCDEGTLFHFLFLTHAKHDDIAYFTSLLCHMADELELDLTHPAATVTINHEDIFRPLITRKFEIEYIYMIFENLVKRLPYHRIKHLINNVGFREKTFVNWLVDPYHRPTKDKVDYLCDLLQLCIDRGYDISHVDDTNKDLYDALDFYKGKEKIRELKQHMYLLHFDNFLIKLNGDVKHDKEFIEDVFGSIENAESCDLLTSCVDLKFKVKNFKWIQPDSFILESIEKLLSVGLNPHSKEINHILHYILKLCGNYSKNDLDFIFKLIDTSIKYNYDINFSPDIFEAFRQDTSDLSIWLKVYRFISKRGYNTYRSNFDFNSEPFDKLNDVYARLLRADYNFNYNVDYIAEVLATNYNLFFEKQFKEKLIEIDKDIFKFFSEFTSIELNNRLAELIYQKRQESIDNSDLIVTANEFAVILESFSKEEFESSKPTSEKIKKYLK